MLIPAAIGRVVLLAALYSLAMPLAHAAGVVMLSGSTAAEGRVESTLPFPDGGRIDANALAAASRTLGVRYDSTILWYPAAGIARRLDELPPDQRVIFSCLADDSEIYDRGVHALTRPAPAGLDPAAWVAARSGRIVWWPAVPESVACGVPIAVLDATPASLGFGDVLLGDSAQADVVLSNIGRIDLDIETIGIEGAGFSLAQNPCNAERLAPGESCTLRVGYAPTAAGAHVGRVFLPNTGTPPDVAVALSGRGLTPAQLLVDPATVTFGDVIVGTTPRRTLTVSNGGDAALTLGSMSASGAGFAIVANSCDAVTLAAAQACSIDIEFAPGASGAYAGTLRVARADAGAGVDVALSGQALTPGRLTLDPVSLDFGDVIVGESLRGTVTLGNGGEAALTLGSMTIDGNGFTLVANPCDGVSLSAAQTCVIEVEFQPSAASAYTGALGIALAGGAAVGVPLSGRGRAGPHLQVSPSTLAFGEVPVGESSRLVATLTNGGDVSLPMGAASLSGDAYSIATDTCSGDTLAAADTCELAIDFMPTAVEAFVGALTLAHGSSDVASVSLQGSGTSPAPQGALIFASGFE